MLLKLKVTEGSNSGKEIIISKEKFLIGRADDCNLRPHSDAISRRHCLIINREDIVGVRDLKSRNGTLVNGKKITSDKRLRSGDTLEVGPLKFEVVLEPLPSASKKSKSTKSAAPQAAGDDMSGMVSAWLEEADGVARDEQRMETREYRFDDTSRIEIEQEEEAEAQSEKKKPEKEDTKDNKEKELGKLPKFEVKKEQPKDTQEAAQMVLRKLFNRN